MLQSKKNHCRTENIFSVGQEDNSFGSGGDSEALKHVENFCLGMNLEEWMGIVARRLPGSWSEDAKIDAVTMTLEPIYQISAVWARKRKDNFSFADFRTLMASAARA